MTSTEARQQTAVGPLSGRRVLVTRPREQAADLVDRLTALGADVIVAPAIRIAPPEDPGPLHAAAAGARTFDWIVFTSVNAVDAFVAALASAGDDARTFRGPSACAVGTATAARLAHHGIDVALVPDEFRAEALADALTRRGPIAGRRVLLPRADIGREVVADRLRSAGALVTEVVAYRTVAEGRRDDDPVLRMLRDSEIDVVTFTSASAVRGFVGLYGDEAVPLLGRLGVAVIGPVTAEAATRLGITVAIQPSTYTVEALANAIADWARRQDNIQS